MDARVNRPMDLHHRIEYVIRKGGDEELYWIIDVVMQLLIDSLSSFIVILNVDNEKTADTITIRL